MLTFSSERLILRWRIFYERQTNKVMANFTRLWPEIDHLLYPRQHLEILRSLFAFNLGLSEEHD